MTKGRPPRQALKEAMVIAERKGRVMISTRPRGQVYDLVLFLQIYTIFIRVKRTRSNLVTVDEIIADCQRELALLRGIPATPVARAELWVRFPNGSWRYFLVTSDGIAEIPTEAAAQTPEGKAPVYEDAAGPDRTFVRYEGTVIDVEPLLSGGPVPDRDPPVNVDPEADEKQEQLSPDPVITVDPVPEQHPEQPGPDPGEPAQAGSDSTT